MKNLDFKRIFFLFLFIFILSSCSNSIEDESTILIGQTWVIDHDNPLDGANGWSLTNHGLTEYVYTLQPNVELESRFISNIERLDDRHFMAHLKKDIYFSDGSKVNAQALSHCLNRIMEENEFSHASAGRIQYTPMEKTE